LNLTNVEVSLRAKVHVTHVITLDVHDLLAELMDLTCEVVLGLLLYVTKLIPTIEIVLRVSELYLSSQLMT
jgi:hypothetical protein